MKMYKNALEGPLTKQSLLGRARLYKYKERIKINEI